MKVLHLTLKKKWFDMIASGVKKEEYREDKHYWRVRLTNFGAGFFNEGFYNFDVVHFYNGGAPSLKYPNLQIECKGIEIKEGNPEWGAEPGKKYFVIKLGEIIEKSL